MSVVFLKKFDNMGCKGRIDEPRTVTKVDGLIDQRELVKEARRTNEFTFIASAIDCGWIIKPSIGDFTEEVAEIMSSRATIEDVQEIVNNAIERFDVKRRGFDPPPRAILPHLVGDSSPTIIKVDKKRFTTEFIPKMQKGEISALRCSDTCYWIMQTSNNYINLKLNSLVSENDNVETVQVIVTKLWNELKMKERSYAQHKAKN